MPAQPNQSLIDGLQCLQLLVALGQPVGSREMAQRLALEPTRVNRLLGTLATLGLAEQTPDRKYQPGPGVHVLAAQSLHGSQLLACALPHLLALREPGLTVALGVLWREHVCYLFHARPGVPVEEAVGRHELHPASQSSIGLLLSAPADEPSPSARLVYPSGDISLAVAIGAPPVAGIALAGKMDDERTKTILGKLRRAAQHITQEINDARKARKR